MAARQTRQVPQPGHSRQWGADPLPAPVRRAPPSAIPRAPASPIPAWPRSGSQSPGATGGSSARPLPRRVRGHGAPADRRAAEQNSFAGRAAEQAPQPPLDPLPLPADELPDPQGQPAWSGSIRSPIAPATGRQPSTGRPIPACVFAGSRSPRAQFPEQLSRLDQGQDRLFPFRGHAQEPDAARHHEEDRIGPVERRVDDFPRTELRILQACDSSRPSSGLRRAARTAATVSGTRDARACEERC